MEYYINIHKILCTQHYFCFTWAPDIQNSTTVFVCMVNYVNRLDVFLDNTHYYVCSRSPGEILKLAFVVLIVVIAILHSVVQWVHVPSEIEISKWAK